MSQSLPLTLQRGAFATDGHRRAPVTNANSFCRATLFILIWVIPCSTIKMFVFRSLNITDQTLTHLLIFRKDLSNFNKSHSDMISEQFLLFLSNFNLFTGSNIISMCVMVFSRSEEGRQDYNNNHCSLELQGVQVFSSPCPRCPSHPQSVGWVR